MSGAVMWLLVSAALVIPPQPVSVIHGMFVEEAECLAEKVQYDEAIAKGELNPAVVLVGVKCVPVEMEKVKKQGPKGVGT